MKVYNNDQGQEQRLKGQPRREVNKVAKWHVRKYAGQ